MGYVDDLRKEYQQLKQQPVTSTKSTSSKEADFRNEYRQLTQPTQPVVEPTTTVQPTVQPTTQTPRGHNVVHQPSKVAQAMNTQAQLEAIDQKQRSGQKLTDEEAKAFLLSKGVSEKDIDYRAGLQNVATQPRKIYTQVPGTINNEKTAEIIRKANEVLSPETKYKQDYGAKEANEELKNLDYSDTTKYLEYKDRLDEAKTNEDYRNISKYDTLLKGFKKGYTSQNNEPSTTDVIQARKDYEAWAKTVSDDYNKFLNAANESQKIVYAQQFQNHKRDYDAAYKKYADALTYDELMNNNIAEDSAKSFGKNVLGGTANIINAGYTAGGTLTGIDATSINADSLLDFNSGTNVDWSDATNALSKAGALGLITNATGAGEGPLSSYIKLYRMALLYPENYRLQNLYNQISNRNYKGSKEELTNELNTIQNEIYQNFKDVYTQDELDAVADQLRHNEIYGDYAAIPNAFGTTGNMVPSILLGTATGGLGEALGGGSMAAAGTVANTLQQVGSMGSLGLGAYSQAMDEALQNGASYNQAQLYGALSGATEVGTEMLGGETVNRFLGQTGKSALGKVFGKAIDNLNIESKVGRIVANTLSDVAGESTEEMISEALNPLWKAITYDANALPQNEAELGEYFKNILKAGVDAIPSTLLMQGAGVAGNVVKTQQVENGIIKSINESDLSQIVKNQLINEVRKASTDVKLGLEEAQYMQDKAYEKGFNLAAQSEQMKQRIPEGYSLPQSTIDILAYTENNRPGLNIAFDTNIQGNGTFVENPDGTRTITLNPNSKRAVEFTLTHELGHDLKGTGEYTQLQNLLTDYAKGKPGYQEALKQLDKTYKESGANYNLQDEATNDMLGQAIGEQEFYNKLAENPTLFNRVTNGLKNLLGNKDTKLKNKIEKLTSNALKQEYSGKQEGTQQSLSEDDKTLAATHNLTEEKLRGVLELGGFPVPSIAISKPDVYTGENFGDATVFFNKETINPSNKENEVYSRDVYSPRFPKVEYKVNSDVRKAIQEEVMNVAGGVDGLVKNPYLHEVHLDMYAQNLEDRINSFGGQEGYIKALSEKHRTPYKYLFLKETNPNFTDVLDENGKIDVDKTNKKIDDIIDQKEYENWLKEKFANIIEKKGIRNNKDYYTNTGTPRSFEALHEEYTLDNVVKIMKALNTTGHESFFMKGFNEVAGTAARKFDSIQDIKNSQDLLQHVSEENYEELLEPISNRLRDIETDIIEKRDEQGLVSNYFIAMDDLGDAIQKVARKSNQKAKLTPQKVVDIMKKEYYDIDTDIAQRIIDVIYDMKNLPTTYFEAKPQRAVGFEEIASILIPNDLSEETKQQLRDRGIKYIEYDRNKEGDREAKYREAAQDVLFSKQNNTWQQFLDNTYGKWNTGTKTNFEGLPSNEELQRAETKSVENEPIVAEKVQKEAPVTLLQTEDDTLFSLTEEEQQEVNNYIENLTNDDSIPDNIKNDLIDRLNNVDNYNDFKELVKEVRRYNVSKFTQDRKSAEGTRGQTIKGKDIREAIDRNVGIEKGNRKVIQDTIKSMNKDMMEGNLTDSKIDEYVDKLGDTMKSYASEYYEQYKGLKDYLRKTKIYVTPEIKRGITDYNDFRKANMGNLVLTSDPNNMTPDQVYKELQEKYGDLLPDDIINPIDQLEQLAETSNGIRVEEGKLRDMMEKQYGGDSWDEASKPLKQEIKELRDAPKVEQKEDLDLTEPNEKKRSWTETSKSNELVREFLDVKDATYVPASNKKQLNYAKSQVDRMGYDEAIKYMDGKINLNERFKAEDIAMGEYLIQEAIKKGDYEKAQDMIQNVAIIGTELGQAVQAMSMITRMTPEGQLKYLNKVINRLNENIDKKNQKRSEDKQIEPIKLDKELATDILKATDDVELQQAMDRALQRLADQMPVSIGDKIAEWRYLAMLANPRTHIRNMVANVGMKAVYGAKNQIQRAIESIARPLERSRTFKKATEDVKNFTNRTAKELDSVLAQTDNKTIEGRIKEMRKVFKFAPIEKLRRLNSNALSWEDNVFTRRAFKNNLNEYLTANGIKTQQDIDLNPEIVQKAINFAKEEAWKTTFHQASKFATELNRIENINGFSKLIVGGTVPFKKTPINIAKTGASYSPLGLLETLTNETVKLRKGDIDASQYIDRLSQGLTGTALFGLGAFLSKLGILKAGTDDEDEYAEAIGQTMKYSLRFGDTNYDISWAAPSAMPLLMGAELMDATKGKEVTFGDIAETLASSINPLSEMSFVSGLNSTIKSYSNSDSPVDAIGAAIKNSLNSYFGQFTPTIGGQINKIIDDTERSTTASKNSKWREGESFARQQMNKIPGASFLLEPKTDIWGNEKKRDSNPAVRAFEALINPGTITRDKTTKVDEELLSLFSEAGDKDVKPKVPFSYFNQNNFKYEMSAKEYTKFKKDYGQKAYNDIAALIDGADYKKADAAEKAEMVKDIYTQAKDYAREEYGINPEDLTEKYGEREAAQRLLDKKLYEKWWKVGDVGLDNFWNAYNAQKEATADKYSNGKTIPLSKARNQKEAIDKAVNQDELNERQMISLYEIFNISNKVY